MNPALSRAIVATSSLARAALGVLAAFPLAAQQPTRVQPTHKGVWEPVSFSENISLREAFFVTIDKGWAAGWQGTIIHTRDAGATWTVQMGGDPEGADKPVTMLRFVDEQHGWALKDRRLLRTEDGESWEDLGAAPESIHELAMSSPTEGIAAAHFGVGVSPTTLVKTRDGGRTWTPVATCGVKAMIKGLNRDFPCAVLRIQFVTQSVGYLVAQHQCAGMGCDPPPILGKTEDGGDSWRFFLGPGDPEVVTATDLFFTDVNTGIVRTNDGKLSRTTDGGATWKGLLASIGGTGRLIFADPEVGWSMEDYKMSFTMDGGARWNSRSYVFPTQPRAWSFPRRDRAYVVGDHGMVFRYSVVPAGQAVAPAAVFTPAMPVFGSPLENQVPELATFAQDLSTVVDRLPDSTGAAAPSAADPGVAPPGAGGFAQDTFAPTPFVTSCCGKPLNRLDAILGMVLQSLPQFVTRFKNTNLLTAGLRMLSTMPGQLGEVRSAFQDFKRATDKQGAQAALARLGSAAGSLKQSTRAAFQKEATP